eukprot:CAMPEP_0119133748 /NCGR_PEP_ID=MMETSP1310-20130426/13533_1 /TAXON_ID=464262 /ORGANISM="Genus nov. species nov., Strain RCC2339" /LENGTH=1200 /DNA_ID=CAMNT_0007124449 /DNA_START=34 /DNA_END=3636 /DNA_ORIENTATION=-
MAAVSGDYVPKVEELGSLNWATAEGVSMDWQLHGCCIRNWNQDCAENWISVPNCPSGAIEGLLFLFAYRNFPKRRLTKTDGKFDKEYCDAIATGEAAQTTFTFVPESQLPDLQDGLYWFIDEAHKNGVPDYAYVKVAYCLRGGKLLDVKGSSVGSQEYREYPIQYHQLPLAPDASTAHHLSHPRGSRDIITRWEPYGTTYQQGHEPQEPPRTVLPGKSAVHDKLGSLYWATNEGKQCDDGKGCSLRVWHSGPGPVLISIKKSQKQQMKSIILAVAWRNFPHPRMTTGNKYFDPEYLDAIAANHTAQTKMTEVSLSQFSDHNGRLYAYLVQPDNAVTFQYVKPIGVKQDGAYFDVRNWDVASDEMRARPEYAKIWQAAKLPKHIQSNLEKKPVQVVQGDRQLRTKWEEYGTGWAAGFEPPIPVRAPVAANAPIPQKLAWLTWFTNEGKSTDLGLGCALRVWQRPSEKEPVYVRFEPARLVPENRTGDMGARSVVAVDLYFTWRNFPVPRFTPSSEHYDAPYLEAIFNNETAQTKRVRIDLSPSQQKAARLTLKIGVDHREYPYAYLKLVGVTAAGNFVDVHNWDAGSESGRAQHKKIDLYPEDKAAPIAVECPDGNRNVMSRWEPYGLTYLPGHAPPRVRRQYPAGGAALVDKLGALNWETNEGRSEDTGKGTVLRIWETTGSIIIAWDEQEREAKGEYKICALDVYFAHRNFPYKRVTKGAKYFDPPYLEAMFGNELGQTGRIRVPVDDSLRENRALIDASPSSPYYYIKLVGVTADDRFVDIEDWSVGSASYRLDPRWHLKEIKSSPLSISPPEANRQWKTKHEPYGRSWKPGHAPPIPYKQYPSSSAPIEERLGSLTWATNEGVSHDGQLGTSIRNWEQNNEQPLVIAYKRKQQFPLKSLIMMCAYRNFPTKRMSSSCQQYFDKEYLVSIWNNKTCQTKHTSLSIPPGESEYAVVECPAKSRFQYVKLIGEAEDGTLFDIRFYSVGTRAYRTKNKIPPESLPPAHAKVEYPEGGNREHRSTWEPYGREWGPGFEPAKPKKEYPKLPPAQMLAKLDWTSPKSEWLDHGEGYTLRIWEREKMPLYVVFGDQGAFENDLEYIDAYFMFQRKNFSAAETEKLLGNQGQHGRHVRVPYADVRGCRAVQDPHFGTHKKAYYYVKLVGVLADGRFVDIVNYNAGTTKKRPVSDSAMSCPALTIPW